METINTHDREIVRDLARRIRQIAADPIMDQRKALWKKHNRLQEARPMILIFPEGSWTELLPDAALTPHPHPTQHPARRNQISYQSVVFWRGSEVPGHEMSLCQKVERNRRSFMGSKA